MELINRDNQVLDPAGVRAQHNALMLRLLWSKRETSRADLARLTGMSRSTVSAIVSDILDTGIVKETRAGSSNGGRRPMMLEFDDDARVVLGLEIGASHIDGVVTNLRGQIIARGERTLPTRERPTETLDAVASMGRDLLGTRLPALLGTGIAMPTPIDPTSGRPLRTVLPAWEQTDVAAEIQQRLSCPVRIDNDANLGALAEQWWGPGQNGGDLVFVKVATGIGAGLIIGGKIVSGAHGVAGELGHLSIDPNGPPCMCGLNGCLNVVIGTKALTARAEARRPHFPDSILPELGIDLPTLIRASTANDPLALEILRFAGERLGQGLANLLNVLDPATIVVGGEITRAGPKLMEPVRETIVRRTRLAPTGGDRVVRSQIDRQSVALGAATLILRAALETSEIPLAAIRETA